MTHCVEIAQRRYDGWAGKGAFDNALSVPRFADASNRTEAVAIAITRGLIQP